MMKYAASLRVFGLVLSLLGTACAQPAASPAVREQPVAASAPTATRGPTRVTITTFRELDFVPYNPVPGAYELRNLVNPGLSVVDDRGTLRPVLAEAVPTLENGLWKLLPDGRMETTWKLKPGTSWHDGTPLTSADLAFTMQLGHDRTTGIFGHPGFASVENVVAPDPSTVVVTWREPYIEADQLFTIWFAWPVPKHLLEGAYQQDAASMSQLPFWNTEFVGSGPYRVRENSPGVRIDLDAFDQFSLGRPRVDHLSLVYTPDVNTVVATMLAGAADLTVGIGFSTDAALDMRNRWPDGKVSFEFGEFRWANLYPQFMDPTPSVVTDLRFRRALMYAIDRQEMADTLQAGFSTVATTFMAPNQPEYAGMEARVIKYEYDPRRATQMLEELGYRKGGDGLLRDGAGRVLELEILGANDSVTKIMLAVADYWQRQGITMSTSLVPRQRALEYSWRAGFPSFAAFTGTHDLPSLPGLYGKQAFTAENNYTVSGFPNWSRYHNADLEGLLNRYFRTIPKAERIELLTQINQHVFENLSTMGLFYLPTPHAVANRVANVSVDRASRASLTWNAHLWEVKG